LNIVNSTAVAGAQITGETTNALTLNGITSSQFLRSDQDSNIPYQLTVGNLVVGSSFAIVESPSTNEIKASSLINGYNFNLYANIGGLANTRILGVSGTTGAVTIDRAVSIGSTLGVSGAFTASGATTLVGLTTVQNNILPSTNGTLGLGSNTRRFGNVFANTVVGGSIVGNVVAGTVTVGNVLIGPNSITIGGVDYASQTYVSTVINGAGKNSQGTKIISTSPPSGAGNNGDIWYQV
jgi:hypothetical protein